MDKFWERYATMSDAELLRAADEWAAGDRLATVEILAILIAVEERQLAEGAGHSGLFKLCTERLKFSEAAAFWRIRTARAAKEHNLIPAMIKSGELNITTVTLLSPYLTPNNGAELLTKAAGKSRKEVEALVAALQPSAPRADVIVRCGPVVMARAQWPAAPAPQPGQPPQPPPALDIVEALDAERRRLHFDVGPETAQLIERAREILRHKFPLATLEDIVREALNLLLDSKDLDRDDGPMEAARPSAPGSRDIPLWVRRAVWKRDEGRCVFVGDEGRSCGGRSWLEFDHIVPFARGGRSDDPENIRLLCRTHNRLEADRVFAGGGAA